MKLATKSFDIAYPNASRTLVRQLPPAADMPAALAWAALCPRADSCATTNSRFIV